MPTSTAPAVLTRVASESRDHSASKKSCKPCIGTRSGQANEEDVAERVGDEEAGRYAEEQCPTEPGYPASRRAAAFPFEHRDEGGDEEGGGEPERHPAYKTQ